MNLKNPQYSKLLQKKVSLLIIQDNYLIDVKVHIQKYLDIKLKNKSFFLIIKKKLIS